MQEFTVQVYPILSSTVKLGIQNKNIDKLHLSNLAPVKQSQIEKPKTKLFIGSKQEYPISTSFPYSLESLKVSLINEIQYKPCLYKTYLLGTTVIRNCASSSWSL